MNEEEIRQQLLRVAHQFGMFSIKIEPYYANCNSLTIYVKDPSYVEANHINAFTVFQCSDIRSNASMPYSPLIFKGDRWTDVKDALERSASEGYYCLVMYGIDVPLIKPYETFEEAMIRIELSYEPKLGE